MLEHLALARSVAGRYVRRLGSLIGADDIHQAALIGLWEALTKHDGVCPFPPYAARMIRLRIIDELRRQAWGGRGHHVQACYFADIDDDAEGQLPAGQRDPEGAIVARMDAKRALAVQLTARELRMCRDWMIGCTQPDIATEHGVSGSRVNQIIAATVKTMRHHLKARPS